MKQTRNKITWFAAIVFSVAVFYAINKGMEQVAITALGGITFIITAYHGSEGYTKGKLIEKNKTE